VLWYKAWLETRSRFLTSLTTLTIFCAVFVHHALSVTSGNSGFSQGLLRSEWKADFYRLLFVSQQYVVIIWVLAVVLLGMGGIVREKVTGTSSLTLSLPVSRAQLLGVRVSVGILEAIVLGIVPWSAIFVVSSLARMPIVVSQVEFYVMLLVGGGLAYFAMAVLISSLVEGEYTAPAVAFGVVLLTAIIFDAWLRPFNLWRLVTGDYYVDRRTFLLSGHFPWRGTLASVSAAVLMLLASLRVIQKREFS
jgi:ABC-type transport system involved in multi-copper enzyme maturation permease subunit